MEDSSSKQTERAPGSAAWIGVRALATLVLVLVAYYVLPDEWQGISAVARTTVFAVCVLALAGLILVLIMRPPRSGVPARAEGLLLTVVISLVFFAMVYYRLARSGGQFVGLETKTDGLYFTLVTTATVGYGDVYAVGQAARVAVMVEIAFNLVFLGAGVSVALERLKQQRGRRHGHEGHRDGG
ncbi:MAG: two pore domain potassium channel family protein [Streptomycetaceae bacterium]|nr:two pore domain potassium channel family protein [Streptomycetaceae bacterium]